MRQMVTLACLTAAGATVVHCLKQCTTVIVKGYTRFLADRPSLSDPTARQCAPVAVYLQQPNTSGPSAPVVHGHGCSTV